MAPKRPAVVIVDLSGSPPPNTQCFVLVSYSFAGVVWSLSAQHLVVSASLFHHGLVPWCDFRSLALSNGNKWLIDYLISKLKCPETNQSHHYMTGFESSSIQKTPDVFKQSLPTSALHLSALRTLERIREPPSTETIGPAIPSHRT